MHCEVHGEWIMFGGEWMNGWMNDGMNEWMNEKSVCKQNYYFTHQVSLCKVCCDFTAVISCILCAAFSITYWTLEVRWEANEQMNDRMKQKSMRKPKYFVIAPHQFSLCKLCRDFTNQNFACQLFFRWNKNTKFGISMMNKWTNDWMNESMKKARADRDILKFLFIKCHCASHAVILQQ